MMCILTCIQKCSSGNTTLLNPISKRRIQYSVTSIIHPIAELMTLLHTAYNLLCYMVGLTLKLVLLTCCSCDNMQLDIAYYVFYRNHLVS